MVDKKRKCDLEEESGIFNQVKVTGIIEDECEFDHEMFGEKFYRTRVIVERLSRVKDYIPVIISERIVEIQELQHGVQVKIDGQFRSYNKHVDNDCKLLLYVFVNSIEIVSDMVFPENFIYLDGYICKTPILRNAYLSQRRVADVLLAVNRKYGKSDYIPCIMWSRNAIFANKCKVGDRLQIYGRIQSRKFSKKNPESKEVEIREAYEISVKTVNAIF